MILEVQIGSKEQKAEIEQEISNVFSPKLLEEINLYKILIPENFDESVSQITGCEYSGTRKALNQGAMAKSLKSTDGSVLVFSPHLYTTQFDFPSRAVIFLHEIIHLKNDRKQHTQFDIQNFLLNDLNWLYDEFLAYYISWQAMLDSIDSQTDLLKSSFTSYIEEYSIDLRMIKSYQSQILELKKSIIATEMSLECGLKKIKQLVNDYLLKTVIVVALESSRNVSLKFLFEDFDFPEPLVSLLQEFSKRIADFPKWFEGFDELEKIYTYFGIRFFDIGTDHEMVDLS